MLVRRSGLTRTFTLDQAVFVHTGLALVGRHRIRATLFHVPAPLGSNGTDHVHRRSLRMYSLSPFMSSGGAAARMTGPSSGAGRKPWLPLTRGVERHDVHSITEPESLLMQSEPRAGTGRHGS